MVRLLSPALSWCWQSDQEEDAELKAQVENSKWNKSQKKKAACDKSLLVSSVQIFQHAPWRWPCVAAMRRMALVFVTYHVPYLSFLFPFFQNSLIKRIKGENVYVKHSNLMLEVGIGIYQCMLVCVGSPPGAHLWARTMMHEGRVLTCDYVRLTSLLPLTPSFLPRCRSPFLCVYLF